MTTREPPDRRAIGEIAQADWTLGVRTYACHEAPQGHPSVPAGLVDGLEANDLNHFRLFCTDTFHLPCNQVLQTTDEELGARSGSGRAIRERAGEGAGRTTLMPLRNSRAAASFPEVIVWMAGYGRSSARVLARRAGRSRGRGKHTTCHRNSPPHKKKYIYIYSYEYFFEIFIVPFGLWYCGGHFFGNIFRGK